MTWKTEVAEAMVSGRVILASSSPRRRDILKRLGFRFEVKTPDFDESELMSQIKKQLPGFWRLHFQKMLKKIVVGKVSSIEAPPNTVVLGFDTLVHYQQQIFGKPKNETVALKMLQQLNGTSHQVSTACLARYQNNYYFKIFHTQVDFYELSEKDLKTYIKKENTLDAAGAYKIQDSGLALIKKFHGPYHNVVGLPIEFIAQLTGSRKPYEVPSPKTLAFKNELRNSR